jgi:hypothetical protein
MEDVMKINKRNPTIILNRWTHFVGAPMRAGPTVALLLFLLIAGCKKDDTAVGPTPKVIPLQTAVQATVNLQSTADFVILAGSLIFNIPTSAITGDIGGNNNG